VSNKGRLLSIVVGTIRAFALYLHVVTVHNLPRNACHHAILKKGAIETEHIYGSAIQKKCLNVQNLCLIKKLKVATAQKNNA